jgi:hypothetical protein
MADFNQPKSDDESMQDRDQDGDTVVYTSAQLEVERWLTAIMRQHCPWWSSSKPTQSESSSSTESSDADDADEEDESDDGEEEMQLQDPIGPPYLWEIPGGPDYVDPRDSGYVSEVPAPPVQRICPCGWMPCISRALAYPETPSYSYCSSSESSDAREPPSQDAESLPEP